MSDILIVSPARADEQLGNAVTANRWARLLQELGHRARVTTEYDGRPCDVLIALHAHRSATSIERFAAEHPGHPLLVALTGTDLYPDIRSDATALRSLERATRLIVLQDRARAAVPDEFRDRVRVIVQAFDASGVRHGAPAEGFQACVLGHLRPVKDPLLAARAARLLPSGSAVTIVQLGRALTPELEKAARAESDANPRYTWRGERPRAEALEVLGSSRLHLLTSQIEGGSNALGEAIALGVPTLSTEIDGSVGLLGEDYPGYFPVGDAPALARLLARAETDAGYMQQLENACARRAHLFEPAHELAAWRKLLIELELPTTTRRRP